MTVHGGGEASPRASVHMPLAQRQSSGSGAQQSSAGGAMSPTSTNGVVSALATELGMDSDDFTQHCEHAARGVNVNPCRKALDGAMALSKLALPPCIACALAAKREAKQGASAPPREDAEQAADGSALDVQDLWLCLMCGYLGCGRYSVGHAKKHSENTGDQCHQVMLHLFNGHVWCYKCDRFVVLASHGVLQRAVHELSAGVEKLKRAIGDKHGGGGGPPLAAGAAMNGAANEDDVRNANAPATIGHKALFGASAANAAGALEAFGGNDPPGTRAMAVSPTAAEPSAKRHKQCELGETGAIRGLTNLGNTCFFNSVMQCLAQTHALVIVLNEELPETQTLEPTAPLADKTALSALKLRVEGGRGQLTYALMKFIETFHDARTHKAAISPGELFNEIRKKAPRFAGWSQQDSHELLRYLMDGLHTEEEKRVVRALHAKHGLADCTKADKLEPKVAEQIKAYTNAANATVVQRVFGGKLLQLIRCARCKHISPRLEPFLDLSLPISDPKVNGDDNPEKKVLLGYDQRAEPVAPNALSQHMLKKQRKEMRKKARRSKQRASQAAADAAGGTVDSAITSVSTELDHSLSLDEEPHADSDMDEPDDEAHKGAGSDADENENVTAVDERTAGEQRRLRSLMETMQPADTTAYNSSFNVGSCLANFTSIEWLSGRNQFGCANCYRLEHAGADQAADDSDDARDAAHNATAGASANSPQGVVAKLTNRRSLKSGKAAAKPRVVYTDAAKRYLIYRPPCVLTLHLKRFQNMGFMTRKWSRSVDFPVLLDLAPYTCKHGEDVTESNGKLLYSLYGVVVHMGSMGGGHYVAYVKLRQRNANMARAFLMQAKNSVRDEEALLQRESRIELSAGAGAAADCRPKGATHSPGDGTWYYVSDSHFSETSVGQVLRAEAYLLFYERIGVAPSRRP